MGKGWRYSYSNSNYVLLGYVIEKVSELSYTEFLQRHIFNVLRMNDSGYDLSSTILSHRASGYQPTPRGLENTSYFDMSMSTLRAHFTPLHMIFYAGPTGSLADGCSRLLRWRR